MHNKAEERKGEHSDIFKEYRLLYEPIFNAFVSDKKRVYGGKAGSFGYPTKFDGIEEYVEKEVNLKTKGRAEVIFRTNNIFKADYQLIIIRKDQK